MRMFAGLDVGFKRTAVCGDEAGTIVWRGVADTHPEALSRSLRHWGGKLAKIGLESGPTTPGLCVSLPKWAFPWCAHPCPTIGVFSLHCNIWHRILALDANASRPERRYGSCTRVGLTGSIFRQSRSAKASLAR